MLFRANVLLGMIVMLAGCSGIQSPPQVTSAKAQDIVRAVREPGANVVLVNMWATWCVPCREEFPDLVKLHRNHQTKGLRVVFVSWDADVNTAQRFLTAQGVNFPSYIKDGSESDPKFIDGIEPKWSGALPATMVYDARGKLRDFREGKGTYAEFEKMVLEVTNPQERGGHL
jgi:thiol-disulfide isomerase/thioredoxin